MAIAKRKDRNDLFRSVSPWEMAHILASGRITGGGNYFSGDSRKHVFFSEDLAECIHHGENYSRYIYNSREARISAKVKSKIEDQLNYLYEKTMISDIRLRYSPESKKAFRIYQKTSNFFNKYQRRHFNIVGKAFRQAERNAKKLKATSYVIKLKNQPGGIRYTGRDCIAGGAAVSEVGFHRRSLSTKNLDSIVMVKNDKIVGFVTRDEFERFEVKTPYFNPKYLRQFLDLARQGEEFLRKNKPTG